MSDMNIAVEGSLSKASSRGINKADLVWMLGLYGTAIGAGAIVKCGVWSRSGGIPV